MKNRVSLKDINQRKVYLSVVIPTRNRLREISELCRSLKQLIIPVMTEFIFVDQSTIDGVDDIVGSLVFAGNNTRVKYYKLDTVGLSKALNFGIKKSRGEIIIITNDDCVVDKYWIYNIFNYFNRNEDVVCLFGKVLPYKKTFKPSYICPSTNVKNRKLTKCEPCNIWKNFSGGGNLSFRKRYYYKTSGFKPWLGVGSFANCAEDQDFAIALLIKGYKVAYDPKIRVWHNRWMTKKEYSRLFNRYNFGTYVCYSYHLLKGVRVKDFYYVDEFMKRFKKDIKKAIVSSFRDIRIHRYTWLGLFLRIWNFRFQILGNFFGYYYYYKERFLKGNN